jgi:hypothetical protein
MKVAAALLLVGFVTTYASVARAAPFDLEWSAPEGCPTREQMLAATRARLGEDTSGERAELFVHGKVTLEGRAITVDLQVNDADGVDRGERHVRFDDRTCAEIEAPTALVLAMMLGVARPHEAASPEARVDAVPAAPTPIATVPKQPPVTAPAPHTPMTLGLSAAASYGSLPNIAFGGALRWTAGVLPGFLVGVDAGFATTWSIRAGAGEATFRSFDAGAFIGVRAARLQRLELLPLLEARGGILTGDATGLSSTFDATSFVGAVGAGVLGRIAVGHALYVDVLPGLRVPFTRDEFLVRERGQLIHVFRPAPVEARLSIGIAWEFR